MEGLAVLAILAVVAIALASPLLSVFAFVRMRTFARELADVRVELVRAARSRGAARPGRRPPRRPPRLRRRRPWWRRPRWRRPRCPLRRLADARPPPAAASPGRSARRAAGRVRPPRRAPRRGDFASNLGPKILAAGAGLAFVVTLGLFVKIAWDNNWVGPTGRVLSGAVFGLGLLAAGVRMMRREYRPLGQALAGAGLAGLYTSAFAAHAFYHLIPRGMSGHAHGRHHRLRRPARRASRRPDPRRAGLGRRLHDAAPALDGRGQGDRAVPVPRRARHGGADPRPSQAVAGDGAHGHARHDRPLRRLVRAVLHPRPLRHRRLRDGALHRAVRARHGAQGAGRSRWARSSSWPGWASPSLAGGADRPEVLFVLALALGAAAVRRGRSAPLGLRARGRLRDGPALHGLGRRVLSAGRVRDRRRLGRRARSWCWSCRGSGARSRCRSAWRASSSIGAALVSVVLCHATDRPAALLLYLLAQAGVAMLVRRRWDWAETIGAGGAALSVLAWMDAFFDARARGRRVPHRAPRGRRVPRRADRARPRAARAAAARGRRRPPRHRALHLDRPLPGPLRDQPEGAGPGLRRPGRPLSPGRPGRAAAGPSRRRAGARPPRPRRRLPDRGHPRAARPARHHHRLGGRGGPAVVARAALRIDAGPRWADISCWAWPRCACSSRHLPLHAGPFDPVLNSRLRHLDLRDRRARRGPAPHARGRRATRARPIASSGPCWPRSALVLLFGVLTAETSGTFDQQARRAIAAGRPGGGAERAARGRPRRVRALDGVRDRPPRRRPGPAQPSAVLRRVRPLRA